MAKNPKWDDVRLLAFYLSVEFAYAAVCFSLPIFRCMPRLHASPIGLLSIHKLHRPTIRNGRVIRPPLLPMPTRSRDQKIPPASTTKTTTMKCYSIHTTTQNLSSCDTSRTALRRLVGLLRETLPIVAELEDMRVRTEREGEGLDTFAKAAGRYRMLYGDLRHALDFRLMTEQRVTILNGLHSLFSPGNPPSARMGKKAAATPQA